MTYHARTRQGTARVEAVRLHIKALKHMPTVSPRIATRLRNHVCTIICLHCMYLHTQWDGHEHLFALPDGTGTVRVIFVLAEEGSWHEYPDSGTLSGGGAPWIDILDMASMDKTDELLEKLVDHEIELLHGQSDRIIMMGASQGGCQSMLRFIRSRQQLAGYIGAVCHVPTMPHTPRDCDPLLDEWRQPVNRSRPIRLLTGSSDFVIPSNMVLRDADRLRSVGGFLDVQVDVQKGMDHGGHLRTQRGKNHKKMLNHADQDAHDNVFDVEFMAQHLPSMLGLAPSPAQQPNV